MSDRNMVERYQRLERELCETQSIMSHFRPQIGEMPEEVQSRCRAALEHHREHREEERQLALKLYREDRERLLADGGEKLREVEAKILELENMSDDSLVFMDREYRAFELPGKSE